MTALEKQITEFKKWVSERIRIKNPNGDRSCGDSYSAGLYDGCALCAKKALKIIESLQSENKSWQEMVESTNQTNQAMSKMLGKIEAENQRLNEKLDYAATIIERFQSYFDHKNQDRLLKELEEIEKAGNKFDTKETKGGSNESN